jgi:hypothetical protein
MLKFQFVIIADNIKAPRVDKHIALLQEDATYILIGGTGGLGRSMAKWYWSRGVVS